jgi:hypothetical protein
VRIKKACLESGRARDGLRSLPKNMLRQIVQKRAVEERNCDFCAFDACIFEVGDVRSRKLRFGEFFGIEKYDKMLLEAGRCGDG